MKTSLIQFEESLPGKAESAVQAAGKTDRAADRYDSLQIVSRFSFGDMDQAGHLGADRGPQHTAQQACRQGDHNDESRGKTYTDKSQHQANRSILRTRPQRRHTAHSVAVGGNGDGGDAVQRHNSANVGFLFVSHGRPGRRRPAEFATDSGLAQAATRPARPC